MTQTILTLVVGVAFLASASVDDKKAEKPKADPEGTQLELTLSVKNAKFTLNRRGLSAEEYRKKLEEAAKAGQPFLPPAVELMFEIKNTSDKPVMIWISGDPVVFTAELKGKGALNLDPRLPVTEEFRAPKAVEVAPGKSFNRSIITLMSGFRGRAQYSYWTEPGEYEIVATFKTGLSPAPKGAKDAMNGFGVVTLTSAPLKITVEEKEKK